MSYPEFPGATDAATLKALAKRVMDNVPRHRDPEHFHVEKSEIAKTLNEIAERASHAK